MRSRVGQGGSPYTHNEMLRPLNRRKEKAVEVHWVKLVSALSAEMLCDKQDSSNKKKLSVHWANASYGLPSLSCA